MIFLGPTRRWNCRVNYLPYCATQYPCTIHSGGLAAMTPARAVPARSSSAACMIARKAGVAFIERTCPLPVPRRSTAGTCRTPKALRVNSVDHCGALLVRCLTTRPAFSSRQRCDLRVSSASPGEELTLKKRVVSETRSSSPAGSASGIGARPVRPMSRESSRTTCANCWITARRRSCCHEGSGSACRFAPKRSSSWRNEACARTSCLPRRLSPFTMSCAKVNGSPGCFIRPANALSVALSRAGPHPPFGHLLPRKKRGRRGRL